MSILYSKIEAMNDELRKKDITPETLKAALVIAAKSPGVVKGKNVV